MTNWQTFIHLDTISNDFSKEYNQTRPFISTFASLTDMVDLTKMVPNELSFFQDLFKLISPTLVYEIFINLLVDILTKSITDVLLESIYSAFQTDESIMSFFNNIIVTFGDQINTTYANLINFSPTGGTNFPLNQFSTPTLLINSIFSDMSDFIDQITSVIGFDFLGNLVLDFGNKIFNSIFGLFYPSGTIPRSSSLLLLSCIGEFVPSILRLMGNKIWGEEFGANLDGKSISQKAKSITKGIGELFLDFIGICYASATVYMLNEFNNGISGTANEVYLDKIAYLGESAPMIAFNLAGEFLEDCGKFFVNQNAMYSIGNQKANIIEAASEVIRIIVNLYYIIRYSIGFLDVGFQLNTSDIIFSVGYIAFVVASIQNLIANFWGLGLNLYDYATGEYTGRDTPTLLFGKTEYWDFIEILLPITTGFTGILGSLFAGLW